MTSAIKSRVPDRESNTFTSMIDIVFLLLIFFILQPFKDTELKLGASLPEQPKDEEIRDLPPKVDIRVQIRSVPANPAGAMYVIDGQPIGMASGNVYKRLAGVLVQRSNGDQAAPVSISPAANINFQHVLRVLDACYRANMANIKFVFNS